jgi:membrane protease YdiL (CAAX protease family)
MSNRWLSPEERRALTGFLRRYSLLVAYGFVLGLSRRRRNAVSLREQVLVNYVIPLAFAAWASGEYRRSPSSLGFSFSNPRRILLHSAIGAALGAAFVLGPTGKRMLGPRDEWERRLASFSPLEASVLFGLTGLTEEAIWRGWTFAEIERVFAGRSRPARAAAAIGISTFLFSSMHLSNLAEWPRRRVIPELQQMAAAAALGLIGGYWRQATGSIIPGMVMHDVANMLRWWTTRAALLREQAGTQAAG